MASLAQWCHGMQLSTQMTLLQAGLQWGWHGGSTRTPWNKSAGIEIPAQSLILAAPQSIITNGVNWLCLTSCYRYKQVENSKT